MLESLLMRKNKNAAPQVPTEPGVFWQGGYYAGLMNIDGKTYAIVVSPKAQGETYNTLNTNNLSLPETINTYDGWANTEWMVADGGGFHPAAIFCRSLTIGGFNDWYLPAMDELELCYRNLKPTTEANFTGNVQGLFSGINAYSIPPGQEYTAIDPSQTASNAFKLGGSESFNTDFHWTSTQHQYFVDIQYVQRFSDGAQAFDVKKKVYYTRAVRRVLIG